MHCLTVSLKPFCEVESYVRVTHKKTETMTTLYTKWVPLSDPSICSCVPVLDSSLTHTSLQSQKRTETA